MSHIKFVKFTVFWDVTPCMDACKPGPQRVHASKNNAVHSQQHILTQL
jgi:hypothetical protein